MLMNETKEPQGTVTVDKNMIYRCGAKAAIFYAEAKRQKEIRQQEGRILDDGFFPLTLDDIKSELGFSAHEQHKIVEILTFDGALKAKRAGRSSQRHILLIK